MISSSNFFKKTFFTIQHPQSEFIHRNVENIQLHKKDLLTPWYAPQNASIHGQDNKRIKSLEMYLQKKKQEKRRRLESNLLDNAKLRLINEDEEDSLYSSKAIQPLKSETNDQKQSKRSKKLKKYRIEKIPEISIQQFISNRKIQEQQNDKIEKQSIELLNNKLENSFLAKRKYQRRFFEAYIHSEKDSSKNIKGASSQKRKINRYQQYEKQRYSKTVDLQKELITPLEIYKQRGLISLNPQNIMIRYDKCDSKNGVKYKPIYSRDRMS